MKKLTLEELFAIFNESAEIIQEEMQSGYLEALAETGENIFQDSILQPEISEVTKKRLHKLYSQVNLNAYKKEELRKAYQFAVLKGMQDHVQANHQLTPDTIGYFMSYLLDKFMNGKKDFSLLDPAIGTGNLLFTVLNRMAAENDVRSFGVDVDELLLKLCYVSANLQMAEVELFNQDALQPLFIDPVDAVICDLPVGYYPDDANAAGFQLKRKEGHSYAHYLFIEQSLNHTKPGGYLLFLIPNQLFEHEEAAGLHEFLKGTAYIQAVLQLPFSMFKSSQSAKSILILQKKKPGVNPPDEVLLAALPKLSNKESLSQTLLKMDKWFMENKS